jgi:hypothetical protein
MKSCLNIWIVFVNKSNVYFLQHEPYAKSDKAIMSAPILVPTRWGTCFTSVPFTQFPFINFSRKNLLSVLSLVFDRRKENHNLPGKLKKAVREGVSHIALGIVVYCANISILFTTRCKIYCNTNVIII